MKKKNKKEVWVLLKNDLVNQVLNISASPKLFTSGREKEYKMVKGVLIY